jgi:hypothetical protein
MTCRRTRCWWRLCPGCGRERRLARDRRVMCQHNRWDSVTWAMVPCEGSGQEPVSDDATGGANSAPAVADTTATSALGDQQPGPAAQRGAA